MSPKQALIYVENIRRALALLSPQNAAYFNVRAKTYSEKITALDKSLREAVLSIAPEKRYLVTCEGAFSYLAKDYGLQEIYLWAINDESQGSPQQVAAVVDAVERYDIPVVFCESTIEPRIQEEVARASGARGIPHGSDLDGCYSRWHSDSDARSQEFRMSFLRFPDEVRKHFRGDFEIGNDAVDDRLYRNDVRGCPAQHVFRLLTDRNDLSRLLVYCDDRWLIDDDAASFHVHKRICGAQIYPDIVREESEDAVFVLPH